MHAKLNSFTAETYTHVRDKEKMHDNLKVGYSNGKHCSFPSFYSFLLKSLNQRHALPH